MKSMKGAKEDVIVASEQDKSSTSFFNYFVH
jgi:hypothetical protein